MLLQKQFLTKLSHFARNVVKPYLKKLFFLMANREVGYERKAELILGR